MRMAATQARAAQAKTSPRPASSGLLASRTFAPRREPAKHVTGPHISLANNISGGPSFNCARLPLQAKLMVGATDDPLEHEADRLAEHAMRMPDSDLAATSSAVTSSPERLNRACLACEEEAHTVRAKPVSMASVPTTEAPPVVHDALSRSGQPLDATTRGFFEPRFGRSLAGVRVHTDGLAARSAEAVGARAYTVGRDIVFGEGFHAPGNATGRQLMAHEIAHVLQQNSAGHDGAGTSFSGSSTLRRSCGPQAIGQPAGCEPGDKTFVDGTIFRFVVNCDDWAGGADAGLLDYIQTIPAGSSIEIHGYASVDGPEAFNGNLAAARALKANALLAAAGAGAPAVTRLVSHGAVPGNAADRRSVVIRTVSTTSPPVPVAPTPDSPAAGGPAASPPKDTPPATPSPEPATTTPGGQGGADGKAPAAAGGSPSGTQGGVQAGMGDVSHHYTTPAGPNDALHEWVFQAMAAYTKQLHGKNQSGQERQLFLQAQYSLTTKQWTLVGGVQASYVFALPANLQLSFWGQLTAGSNVTTGSPQLSLSAGAQFAWQPRDWFTIGAQLGVGPTVQSGTPTSIDRGALFFLQVQK
jgi:hypothetical protein